MVRDYKNIFIRTKEDTKKKLKDIKKASKRTLKNYDAVINYLLEVREKYFRLKNKL